jgi:SOS-response transcriptional repressor LexA
MEQFQTGSSCSNADPFALQVLGNSMEPEFPDQCIVIIDPAGVVSDGSYVFATYNGEYIFRRLKIENGEYFLVPENDKYETLSIPGIEAVHGKIIQRAGTRRKDRKRYE